MILNTNEAGNLQFSADGSRFYNLVGAGKAGVKVHRSFSARTVDVNCNQRMRVVRAGYRARDFRSLRVSDFCTKCFTAETAQAIIDAAQAAA